MDDLVTTLTTLARASSPRGEVVLRRRGEGVDAVEELIVNGAFAMDSAETGSERALAAHAPPGSRVLVGGLGLGFTVAELLDRDVRSIDVVELEGALVGWAQDGVTAGLGRIAADPRVHLRVGDIGTVLAEPATDPQPPWDTILLDVDNGPDFLIHAGNAVLYRPAALSQAYQQLSPGGLLAIW